MSTLCVYENYLRDRYVLGQSVHYAAGSNSTKPKSYDREGNEYTWSDEAGDYVRQVGGPGGGRTIRLSDVEKAEGWQSKNEQAQAVSAVDEKTKRRPVNKKKEPQRKISFDENASYEELVQKHYPDGKQVDFGDLGYTPSWRKGVISLPDITLAIESNDLKFFYDVLSPTKFNDKEVVVLQDPDGNKRRLTTYELFELIQERLEDNNPEEPYRQDENDVDDALYGYKWVKIPRELRQAVDKRNKTRQINRAVSEAIVVLGEFSEQIEFIARYDEIPGDLLTGLVDCYLGIEKTAPHHDEGVGPKKIFLSRVKNFLAGVSLAKFLADNEGSPAKGAAVRLIENFLESALSKTPERNFNAINKKAEELGFSPYSVVDVYNSFHTPADYREPKRPVVETLADSPAQEPEPKDVIAREDSQTSNQESVEPAIEGKDGGKTTTLERSQFDAAGLGLPGKSDAALKPDVAENKDAAYFIRRDLGTEPKEENAPRDPATKDDMPSWLAEQIEREKDAFQERPFVTERRKRWNDHEFKNYRKLRGVIHSPLRKLAGDAVKEYLKKDFDLLMQQEVAESPVITEEMLEEMKRETKEESRLRARTQDSDYDRLLRGAKRARDIEETRHRNHVNFTEKLLGWGYGLEEQLSNATRLNGDRLRAAIERYLDTETRLKKNRKDDRESGPALKETGASVQEPQEESAEERDVKSASVPGVDANADTFVEGVEAGGFGLPSSESISPVAKDGSSNKDAAYFIRRDLEATPKSEIEEGAEEVDEVSEAPSNEESRRDDDAALERKAKEALGKGEPLRKKATRLRSKAKAAALKGRKEEAAELRKQADEIETEARKSIDEAVNAGIELKNRRAQALPSSEERPAEKTRATASTKQSSPGEKTEEIPYWRSYMLKSEKEARTAPEGMGDTIAKSLWVGGMALNVRGDLKFAIRARDAIVDLSKRLTGEEASKASRYADTLSESIERAKRYHEKHGDSLLSPTRKPQSVTKNTAENPDPAQPVVSEQQAEPVVEPAQEQPAKPRPERWTPLKSKMNDDDRRVVENTRKRLNYGLSELAWRLGNAKEKGDVQRVKQLVAAAAKHYLEQARRAYRSHGGTEALAAFDEALGGDGLTVGQLRDRIVDKFRKIAQMEANDLFKFAGERLDEFESFAEADSEPITNKEIYLNSIRDKNGKREDLGDKDSEVVVEDGKPSTLFPDEYFGRRMGSERGLADAVRRALKSMTRKGEYRDSFENGAEYAVPKYNIDTPTRMGRFLAHGYKDSLDGKPVSRDDYSEQRYQELLKKFPTDRESRKLNNLFNSNNREVNKLIKENEDEYKQSENKSKVVQRVVDGIRGLLSRRRQNGSVEAPPSESLRNGTTGEVLETGGADRSSNGGDGRNLASVIAEETQKSDIPESRVREELDAPRQPEISLDSRKAAQSLRNLIQRVYDHDGLSERIKSRAVNVFGDTLSTPGETGFESIGEHDKHLFELVNKLDKAKKRLGKIQERFDENPDSEKLERALDKAEDVANGIEDRLIKAVDKFIQPYSGKPKSERPAPVAKKQPLLSTSTPPKEDKTDWEKDLELQEELKPVSKGSFNPDVEPYSYIPERNSFFSAGSVTPRYHRDKEIANTIQKWVDEQRKTGRSTDIVPYMELFYPGESPNKPGRPAKQPAGTNAKTVKEIEAFDRVRSPEASGLHENKRTTDGSKKTTVATQKVSEPAQRPDSLEEVSKPRIDDELLDKKVLELNTPRRPARQKPQGSGWTTIHVDLPDDDDEDLPSNKAPSPSEKIAREAQKSEVPKEQVQEKIVEAVSGNSNTRKPQTPSLEESGDVSEQPKAPTKRRYKDVELEVSGDEIRDELRSNKIYDSVRRISDSFNTGALAFDATDLSTVAEALSSGPTRARFLIDSINATRRYNNKEVARLGDFTGGKLTGALREQVKENAANILKAKGRPGLSKVASAVGFELSSKSKNPVEEFVAGFESSMPLNTSVSDEEVEEVIQRRLVRAQEEHEAKLERAETERKRKETEEQWRKLPSEYRSLSDYARTMLPAFREEGPQQKETILRNLDIIRRRHGVNGLKSFATIIGVPVSSKSRSANAIMEDIATNVPRVLGNGKEFSLEPQDILKRHEAKQQRKMGGKEA